jgi:mannose-6-phosphate isomerase-like protein (cupin superfamily)
MSDTDRLVITHETAVDETASRGDLEVRRIFDAASFPFESSFQFILRNSIPAGGANERHIHPDVEKVYYFLSGTGEVSCGPWTKPVAPGDFLFFPAAIEHEIHAGPDASLEFIVCAAQTLTTPRGLDDASE